MKKDSFLRELRRRLSELPQADIDQAVSYYSEMIDDRMEEGRTEEEAIKAIGTPGQAAAQIYRDQPLIRLVKAKVTPNRKLRTWELVLLILGSPLWLSLLLAAAAILIAFFAIILSLDVMLWAVNAALGGCCFAGILQFILMLIQGNTGASLALLGFGICAAGLALFLFYGNLQATKSMLWIIRKLLSSLKSLFYQKEALQ